MAGAAGTILPDSYFDGLSTLWGGCAYVGAGLVAVGLVFQSVHGKPEPAGYIWLFAKVFFIGIATLFLREWLMRLNDVVLAFGSMMGVDPLAVDSKFVTFISGKAAGAPDTSVWDVLWGTKSIGTAVAYAFLWFFGWIAWSLQYIIKLIGGILLTAGWALSPIFLSFFMIRPMAGVASKYVVGLIALVCWPFGWVMAAIVTNAMIETAATATLIPVVIPGAAMVAPALTVLLIGGWMIVSSILAPYITTRVLLMGVNPGAAFAQGVGGVTQAAFAGGIGAATAAATVGAAVPVVAAVAALGAVASGAESAARGGDSARTVSAAGSGMAGFYRAGLSGRQTAAMEKIGMAQERRATAAESFNDQFHQHARNESGRQNRQPHHPDPNQAAIDIESHAKS